jgi:hypothetical protein
LQKGGLIFECPDGDERFEHSNGIPSFSNGVEHLTVRVIKGNYDARGASVEVNPGRVKEPLGAIELGQSYCQLHQLSEILFVLSHIIGKQNMTFGFLNVFNDK